MAPEATPPESKAMAVNILGDRKDKSRANAYPGARRTQTGHPVSSRSSDRATEMPTPTLKTSSMVRRRMVPPETVSTLSLIHIYITMAVHDITAREGGEKPCREGVSHVGCRKSQKGNWGNPKEEEDV